MFLNLMNIISNHIKELKTYTFYILLKNSFNTITKNQYFDNTFSSITFKDMFFSALIENGFGKVKIGFEDNLLRSLTNGKESNV